MADANVVSVDLQSLLERLHDRCVARNLRAAGLGGINTAEEEKIYGRLDPNVRLADGDPILHATVDFCLSPQLQARYVAMLLAEGADVNATDADGQTVLMRVCRRGFDRTAKQILRQKDVDLRVKDAEGNTALHLAAKSGEDKIVRQILKCQRKRRRRDESTADLLDETNQRGETAVDVALQSGNFLVSHSLEAERLERGDSAGRRYMHTSLDAINSPRSDEEGLVEPLKRLRFTSSPNLAAIQPPSDNFDLLANISINVDVTVADNRSAPICRTKSVGPIAGPPGTAPKPNLADRIRNFINRKAHGEVQKIPTPTATISGPGEKYQQSQQPTDRSSSEPPPISCRSQVHRGGGDNLTKFRLLLRRQRDDPNTNGSTVRRSETSEWTAGPQGRNTPPPPVTLRRNQTTKRSRRSTAQQPLRALPPLRGIQPGPK